MDERVLDNPERNRYELWLGERFGGWTDYRRADGEAWLLHVEVAPDLRGNGYADRFMREIVADLERRGETPKPVCSYAVAWLRRNR